VYYYAGGKPIAMRVMPPNDATGTLYYLHSDHLGSTSVTTCGSGACGTAGSVVARQWYYPYGAVRGSVGTLPTQRTFTGQYSDPPGLMYFNARYYSQTLGRFVSADTIVPGAGNPQALNRYAYANNSPMVYVDPSGHDACTGVAGTYEPDCGVDGWYGVEDYEARQKLRAMWEQSRKEAWDFFGGIVTLIGSVLFEPIDWAVTASDCLSGNCSPLALVGLLPVIPASVANRIDDLADTARAIPHGFSSTDDFQAFGSKLKGGLTDAGYSDAVAAFQGSSVTGVKHTTGQPFDVERVSDFDIALASPTLLARAKELGIELRSGGVRTRPLTADDLESLGLSKLAVQLSQSAGRPVNFMIFDTLETAVNRAPSIVVP
jgi:RHS repeat-associated protein